MTNRQFVLTLWAFFEFFGIALLLLTYRAQEPLLLGIFASMIYIVNNFFWRWLKNLPAGRLWHDSCIHPWM